MLTWIQITLILCAFGILREIRPSEPFVSEFLLGEWRNITEEQLNRDVYPIGTYSYLVQLIVIFLITDFLRFKPVIILSGLSGIAVYAILLWTSSLEWLQVSQFFYGMYMATEVAYFTYIYAKVDESKYPRVTSYTRIASLTGRFLSGVSAQLLTVYGLMNYRDLNYITFAAQILSTFWAIVLPPVAYGIYFHRRKSLVASDATVDKGHLEVPNDEKTFKYKVVNAATLIVHHAKAAYSRPKVLAWSALYASALALYVQVQTYVQLLWKEIQDENENPVAYNGAVEAATTLFGAGGAYISSLCTIALLPGPVAAVQGVSIFLATSFNNVYVSYAGYIMTGVLYHYIITLASYKIASQLSDESCFGLIFGINTLIGTGLQSIFTSVFIQTLHWSVRSQYYALSGLYLVLASAWLAGWLVQACKQKQSIDINTQT